MGMRVGMVHYLEVSHLYSLGTRKSPEFLALKDEYDKLDQEVCAMPEFRSEHRHPYMTPAFDGIFFPSNLEVANEGLREFGSRLRKGARVADLGGGDGRIACLAALYGSKRAVSIEGHPRIWAISQMQHARLLAKPGFEYLRNVEMVNMDFFKYDLTGFDIVFMYYPEPADPYRFNRDLHLKLARELSLGGLFIEHRAGNINHIVYEKRVDPYLKDMEYPETVVEQDVP